MRGRYVFHLCDLYMNTIEGDKIETLTHEASHHETMCPDLPLVSIVVPFFGLTNSILGILKGIPKKELQLRL